MLAAAPPLPLRRCSLAARPACSARLLRVSRQGALGQLPRPLGTLASGAALCLLFLLLRAWWRRKRKELILLCAYGNGGEKVAEMDMSRGSLAVTEHWEGESVLRALCFQPTVKDEYGVLVQSVVPLEEDEKGRLLQTGSELPEPYTQTLVAAALAVLQLLGSLEGELRILLIGAGGGAMATWLTKQLPRCHVDAVESERVVVDVAHSHMGFRQTERLRLIHGEGAEFALAAVEHGRAYDAVLLDAFDCNGQVPNDLTLPDEGLALALQHGLLKESGVMAGNLAEPEENATEALSAYDAALKGRPGLSFTVRELEDTGDVEGEGNVIVVRAVGEALKELGPQPLERLEAAAQAAEARLPGCGVEVAKLAVRGFKDRAL